MDVSMFRCFGAWILEDGTFALAISTRAPRGMFENRNGRNRAGKI